MRNWNPAKVICDQVNVIFLLGGNRNDWRALSDRVLDELFDILLLLDALLRVTYRDVDLVL